MDVEYQVDLSDIEPVRIKENYVFALGFPQQSGNTQYVVMRAIAVGKPNIWLYDPFVEGMLTDNGTTVVNGQIAASTSVNGITGHTYIQPQRPSSKYISNQSLADFIFRVTATRTKYGNLYQLFFGVSPGGVRIPFQQPFNVDQMGLPPQNPSATYNQFGSIPGDTTPLQKPGPISEIFVPPGLDFGIGFINDNPRPIRPLMAWVVNYLKYELVTDVDLVYEVLHTTKYRPKTVGGVYGYAYDVNTYFGIQPVTLGMDKGSIQNAIGGI